MYQQSSQQPNNQLPMQYVVINNQIYPVQTSNQLPGGNPIYSPSPNAQVNQQLQQQQTSQRQPPQFQVIQQQPNPSAAFQPPPQQFQYMQNQTRPFVPTPNPQIIPIQGISTNADEQYINNVVCYVVTYLFFFIGCIGVQYGLNGCTTAASMWISSYVFLIVALVLFFVVKKYRFIWLLATQTFFLSLSFILEISAFATAVQHPVLYNYEWIRQLGYYNNRLLQYYYSSSSQDYFKQDGNMCHGQYNWSTDYCSPLQYGILAYEVLGFICYILVFIGLARRIYGYYKHYRLTQEIQVQQVIPNDSVLVDPRYQQQPTLPIEQSSVIVRPPYY